MEAPNNRSLGLGVTLDPMPWDNPAPPGIVVQYISYRRWLRHHRRQEFRQRYIATIAERLRRKAAQSS